MTGRNRARSPTVSLWHPFTARSIGWAGDDELRRVHSRPHVAALEALAREQGLRCRIEYLTDRLLPSVTRDELPRWFWPRTTRWRRAAGKFRWEWSTPALLAAAAMPADVTIINMSGHGSPFSRALATLVRRRGKPYVAMVGGWHATLTGPQLRFFQRAAVVAVHNRHLARQLADAGVDEARVHVVPLGVDVGRFAPDADRDRGRPTLLYVGRFVEWKGLHHLVAAMPEIRAAHPDLLVRMVGPGFDSPYGRELLAAAEGLGVAEALLLEPPQAYRDLPALYRGATAFVLPSEGEGFGMVVLEAMACGRPVVALSVPGGPTEIIEPGVDGLLVSPDHLGAELAALLADPERIEAMGRAARTKVLDRYTTEVTNRSIAALVDQARRGR